MENREKTKLEAQSRMLNIWIITFIERIDKLKKQDFEEIMQKNV